MDYRSNYLWNRFIDWGDILMSLIDGVILVSVVIVVIYLIYYNFIKKRPSACSGCVHQSKCTLGNVESLKKYYKTQCDNREEAKVQD